MADSEVKKKKKKIQITVYGNLKLSPIRRGSSGQGTKLMIKIYEHACLLF